MNASRRTFQRLAGKRFATIDSPNWGTSFCAGWARIVAIESAAPQLALATAVYLARFPGEDRDRS